MVTKFDVKEKLWLMDKNKPTSMGVIDIHITNSSEIFYRFNDGQNDIVTIENLVFKTKEELVKSLF